jgi:cytochrome c biogenesis protein
MILISILIGIGTLIPQHRESEFYTQRYGELLGKVILFLQFDKYSSSVLFGVLLSLFFVNTLVCTLSRVLKIWPSFFKIPEKKENMKLKISRDKFLEGLKKEGFKIKKTGEDFVARRGVLSRIAPDIIHFGILAAIVGGLITNLTYDSQLFTLKEGDVARVDNIELRLVDFEFQLYEDGRPKDWISKLEIVDDEGKITKGVVEVNKPLRIGSGRIYQWSYKQKWEVKLKFEGLDFEYSGPDSTIIEHGGYKIYLSNFFPNLKISGGRAYSEGNEPLNPAIYVEYWKDDNLVARHWVFEKFDFAPSPEDFNIICKIEGYYPALYTGLLYVREKGEFAMFISLLLIGLGSILLTTKNYVVVRFWENNGELSVYMYSHRIPKEEILSKITGGEKN